MNNRIKKMGLIGFFIVTCFLIGCIPEDSLEWSDDGSIGLLRVDEALYLVDGQTGDLTEIAQENIQAWPDISNDGSLIAYCQQLECDDISEGLKLLPPGQVKMIKYNADKMRENILKTGELIDGKFPVPQDELLIPEEYGSWPIRYMCENADDELLKILGDEGIRLAKEKALRYYQVVVAPTNKPGDKQIAATNIFGTVATQLSPDKKYVGYIMQTQNGQDDGEYSLYVTSIKGDNKSMLIDRRVALNYDWRKDSKAIAYINADTDNLGDDELALGTLEERVVVDEENNLLAEPINLEEKENGSVEMYKCTSDVSSLVGLIYYPWLKVQYGPGERIFFSSCVLPLPASKRDEPGWSLFCYDMVTGSVTNVLPPSVSNYTSQAMPMCQFSLSPNGKYVLLPMQNNRFVAFVLGTDAMEIPLEEDEGFGEEGISTIVPSFKGNTEATFLVSGDSHFLAESRKDPNEPGRYEFVIISDKDGLSRILSESWPDEIMEKFTKD